MLTCNVMMTHKTHLYCLMSLSNSLSSALSLVPFIDAKNEKKRHFYHLFFFIHSNNNWVVWIGRLKIIALFKWSLKKKKRQTEPPPPTNPKKVCWEAAEYSLDQGEDTCYYHSCNTQQCLSLTEGWGKKTWGFFLSWYLGIHMDFA